MGLLVSFDAAVAFLLLFGASLLVRSTARLLEVDPGFSPAHAAKLDIDVSGPAYGKDPEVVAYFDRVLERVRAVPGVASAGISSELPLGGNWDSYGIRIEGKEPTNPTDEPDALRYGVSPGYLQAMGIPVRRGRGITEADREGAPPVVLVNERFARRGWPGEDPIGKRLRLGDHPLSTVVGIVGDVRHRGLDVAGGNQVYVSAAQWADSSVALVVRFSGGPTSQLSAVRAAIRSVDSDQPITRVASLDRVVGEAAGTHRFAMNLLAAFAGLATLLAAVGIYGVVSGFVGRRTREIGIRIALGASRRSILSLVAGRAVTRTALGLAVGIAAALGAGRILRGLLFEVAPTDVVALSAGAVVVLAVAAAATLWPARRATRVDPIVALRED